MHPLALGDQHSAAETSTQLAAAGPGRRSCADRSNFMAPLEGENAELRGENAELRGENARLRREIAMRRGRQGKPGIPLTKELDDTGVWRLRVARRSVTPA